MRLSFSEEQEELRRVVRRFLEERSPVAEVRRLMETEQGYDPAVWRALAQDLGLTGVHVPEEYGGQGLGMVELGLVLEEMGRALLCAPYFASVVLGAQSILKGGTDAQRKERLPGIASGETIATLALCERSGRWDAPGIGLLAKRSGGAYRLDGEKTLVVDGHTADLIVVAARLAGTSGPDGVSLFTIGADAAGLVRRPQDALDPTRKLAALQLHEVAATPLGEPGQGFAALSATLDLSAIALAHEMVGSAQKLLEMSVDYAKTRMQFGRPIGSFQAIKHKCADILLELELAKSAAYYAAAAADEGDAELPALASLAKACASDAFFKAAAETIQIHGGIGFTWEHDAHLYFKRAKSSEVFLGDPGYHRELLAQRWGI
jgi:alkylation response protein AidB-like acyl-CoA dehydrogenase